MNTSRLVLALVIGQLLDGCSRMGFDQRSLDGGRDGGALVEIAVAPEFPTFGRDWNDYVALGEGTGEQACDPTGDAPCVHGGERRQAVVRGVASCAGISAEDELGVFSWSCRPGEGAVTIVARSFRAGKGLADLLTAAAWRLNRLEVRRGGVAIARSQPAAWWGNPVRPLPASESAISEATGHAPGEILTVAEARTTSGYGLDVDRVALVALRGGALSYSGSQVKNCNAATGLADGATDACVVTAGGRRFLWLEGAIGGGASRGLMLVGVRYCRVHRLSTGKGWYGVDLRGSSRNRLTELTVFDVGGNGINLYRSDHNELSGVAVASADRYGINLDESTGNTLKHLAIANARATGLMLFSKVTRTVVTDATIAGGYGFPSDPQWHGRAIHVRDGSTDNTLTNLRLLHNQAPGVIEESSRRNTYSHVTAIGNHIGLWIGNASNITIVKLLAVNSVGPGTGAHFTNVGCVFYDLGAVHSGGEGISLDNAKGHTFAGALYVGGNSRPCGVHNPLESPGLIHQTCTDTGLEGSSSYTGQASTAVLHTGLDLTHSFVGPVTTADALNGDDQAGRQVHHLITDWLSFENAWRAWGKADGTFPGETSRGACRGEPAPPLPEPLPDPTCQIWDWRLRADDTQLVNRNGAFVAGAVCPDAVRGDRVVTDQQTSPNTFLVSALEIVDDEVGDDDGLCESREACVYSPHAAGAYQGEGEYTTATCEFVGDPEGIVEVTMHGYPTAGATP